MNTDQLPELAPVFPQMVSVALTKLRERLTHNYEQTYPQLAQIIHLVLDQEEARAWELSSFPHLLLPDLVEAHIAKLNLQPAERKQDDIVIPYRQIPKVQPALVLCG